MEASLTLHFGTGFVNKTITLTANIASDLTYIVALLRDRKTQQILPNEVGTFPMAC